MWNFPLFPESASTMSGRVDAIFWALVWFGLFFSVLICILVVAFAVKYRRGSRANRAKAISSSETLEFLWVFIPFLITIALFVWASVLYYQMYRPPADATEVAVLGKQWMWELTHPNGKREINELHIPLGRAVKLSMTSQDVIHSFYVPAFRAKQDVVPGRYTSIWFQPTKTGRFHLFCAEYCGTKHSGMIGWVEVMEPSAFQQWLETGPVGPSMAEEGGRLFRRLGCSGCHGLNATVRAPLLDGVFGSPVPLSSGKFVDADERYIRDSILLPKSEVVAGYDPVMPTFQGQISEADLLKVIAYIKSLGQKERVER